VFVAALAEELEAEIIEDELELIRYLLNEAEAVEWVESGEHIFETVNRNGEVVRLTTKLERVPSPIESRSWSLENWNRTTHVLSPGNWNYTLGWSSPTAGDIALHIGFRLHRNPNSGVLLIDATSVQSRVNRSPANFATAAWVPTRSGHASTLANYSGIFEHRSNVWGFPSRFHLISVEVSSFGQGNQIKFTNDLLIWRP